MPKTTQLFRFYLSNDDGDFTRTLALVWAENDEEAMTRGWASLETEAKVGIESEILEAERVDEPLFTTVECLSGLDAEETRDRLENALLDIPALAPLFDIAADRGGITAGRVQDALVATLLGAIANR